MKKRASAVFLILISISCALTQGRDVNNISDWMPQYTEGMKFVYNVIDSQYTHFANDTLSFDNITRDDYQSYDSVISVSNAGYYDLIKMHYSDDNDSSLIYYIIIDNDFHRAFISSDTSFSMLDDHIILYRPVKPGTQWTSMIGGQYYSFMIMSVEGMNIYSKTYDEIVYIEGSSISNDDYHHYWLHYNDGFVRKKTSHENQDIPGDPYHTEITTLRTMDSRLQSIIR